MRILKKLILGAIIAGSAFLQGNAQKLTSHKGEVADTYNFWLYTPKHTESPNEDAKPIVVFLHGASLCGNDLNKVRRYGTIDAIDKGRELDAFVVAPQNPGGSWQPDKVMKIVDWVSGKHAVDQNRIYVIGMSLGGYGTIDMAASYPDRVAAAIAMCGGGTSKNLGALNDVPLWIIHGTSDNAVSIAQSDKVVSEMKKSNSKTPRLIYDRVPGWNHGKPARLLYLQEVYDWLFNHTLQDDDRKVSPGFDLSNGILQTAYKGLQRITNATRKTSKSKSRASVKSKVRSKRHKSRKR